jgi:single-stranded DNA-binding protein
MEVSGKIKILDEAKVVGSSNFRKRELVLETNEQYPQFITINFIQDRCDLLNGYNKGENVKVAINLKGREWQSPQGETKYFNDIQGWRIERVGTENATASNNNNTPPPSFNESSNSFENEVSQESQTDDLPF